MTTTTDAQPVAAAAPVVLEVDRLKKTFKKPFTGTKVEAVREVSFSVARGEIFGFLGPNGAGKTTTLKMLVGLIKPTAGRATLLGAEVPSPAAMRRVGFLPESPYIYPYLTPREFVSLCGRLNGMSGSPLARKVEEVLARTGVGYAMDRNVKALSKGMLQRVGLAAALVHEPELLILDEPMSGLDPVGRKEVRDLIVDEKAAGRTVLFSSHILSDIERVCDRLCILKKGEVVVSGKVSELSGEAQASEITLGRVDAALSAKLAEHGQVRSLGQDVVSVEATPEQARIVLQLALEHDARIDFVSAKRQSLEDLFVAKAL